MMKFIGFTVALTVGVVLAQVGLCGMAAATSSELTDAFSRLDALAEELAERQRELGGAPEAPSDPTPLPLPETPPPVDEALAPAPTRLPVDTQGQPSAAHGRTWPSGCRVCSSVTTPMVRSSLP